jgi:hypothetical protein
MPDKVFTNEQSTKLAGQVTQNVNDAAKAAGSIVPQISFGVVWKPIYTAKDIGTVDEKKFIDYAYAGAIKFVKVDSDTTAIDVKTLPIAFPLNRMNVDYPVKGEPVLIMFIANSYYYLSLLSINNNLNNNINSSFAKMSTAAVKTTSEDSEDSKTLKYIKTWGNPDTAAQKILSPTAGAAQDERQDEKFVRDDDVLPLLPLPGHKLIQGRWGNSIRLGRINDTKDKYRPNLKIRVHGEEQAKDKKHKKLGIEEDIENDGNSIWITCGESEILSPYKFDITKLSPIKFPIKAKTIGDKFNDNLIQIKTDKYASVTIEETLIMSKKFINIYSGKQINISSNDGFAISDATGIELDSDKVYVGTGATEAVQFIPQGLKLLKLLIKLTDNLATHKHPTPAGPSGPPLPPELMTFKQLSASEWKTIEQKEAFVPPS